MTIEHWERTEVRGYGEDVAASEVVLHRRGQDPLTMAMRRNPLLPGCQIIRQATMEAFTRIREDLGGTRQRKDIPRDRRCWEFEWDMGWNKENRRER